MATAWFSVLLLLSASGRALVIAHEAQVHVLGEREHAQHGAVRLPRGLLDGLVGAVPSPVLGTGGDDCSSARGDSVNIGATLPLGISASIAGSSTDAHSRQGCGAAAGSSSAGGNPGGTTAASAGAIGYGAGGSGAAGQDDHGSGVQGATELNGQGQHPKGVAIPSVSAGTGGSWQRQSGSQTVSSSSGQSRHSVALNAPVKGLDSSGGLMGGTPVRGEAASVSDSSTQSASVSSVKGGSVTGQYGQGNLGDQFSGYGGGHVDRSDGYGAGSFNAGGYRQESRRDGMNQSVDSGVIGGTVSSSSSASGASSGAGTSVGARPGAARSSSRSDANSSSHSNAFLIGA